MKRLHLLVVVTLIAALPVLAQKNPEDSIGFNAEKLYDFDGLDSVAMFNGNLTITLPLVRYPVSATLSYSLNLIYNSKSIDYEGYDDYTVPDPPQYVWVPHPSLGADAGLGWRVTMGRLYPPGSVTPNQRSSLTRNYFTYEGPAGDEHQFTSSSDSTVNVILCPDQAGLRLVKRTDLEFPTREVEFPSGEVHRFQQLNTDWRLTQIRDRFGNYVAITYQYDTADNKRATKWFIDEYIGGQERRSQTLNFTYYSSMEYASAGRGMQLTSMNVTAPADTTATYTFTQTPSTITLPTGDLSVTLLTTLALPDPDGNGSQQSQTYTFSYLSDGSIGTITYPTGGSTSYAYQAYQFSNQDDVCGNSPWGAVGAYATSGVRTRTIADGTASRIWTYYQHRGPQVEMEDGFTRCGNGFYGPFYWSRTSVLSPKDGSNKRVRTDYYFNIFGGLLPSEHVKYPLTETPAKFNDYSTTGMPPAGTARGPIDTPPEETPNYPADVSASDGTRFLMSQTYAGCSEAGDCTNGTLLRSVYTEASPEMAFTKPPKSTKTVYEDDSGCGAPPADEKCVTITTMDGDNGFGLYTTETASDNFGSSLSDRSVDTTSYAIWSSADRINKDKTWIRDIYTKQTHTEGGATAKTLFRFDGDTGRLTGQRMLAGSAPAASDTLALFGYEAATASTNYQERVIERYFGGHGGGLSTAAGSEFDVPTTSATPKYLLRHSHDSGVRVLTEYLTPSSTCTLGTEIGCETLLRPLQRSIDSSTGLVTGVYDVSGVGTTYGYDSAFRFDRVTLPTGVTRSYSYANTRATETMKKSDGSVLRTAIWDFDGLGRVKRSSATLPSSKVAVVDTEYDELGRKHRVSQPVQRDSHPDIPVGTDWTETTYDAFGRPTSITAPDTKSTSITYTGVRKIARTTDVATSLTGTTAATTTETYDGRGRVVSVEENTGDTSSTTTSGAKVTTSYTYDVGGRIATVSMKKAGATSSQDRSFEYDNRGFLTKETHPESGETSYAEHDARGHAATRTAGGRTLRFTFDKAERLTNVDEEPASSTSIALKKFEFADSNTSTQSRLGKLQTATRHNHLTDGGAIDVIETYEYDLQGRVNQRITDVKRGTSTIQTFSYGMNYDDFGSPKDLTMPTCTATGCGNAFGTITFGRDAGFLTSISSIASLTYLPSGMVNTVKHLSNPNATDTYAATNGLPRPSTITFGGGVECPAVSASTITASDTVCPDSLENDASVTHREGITHQWTISSGATITSATTGESIKFTAAHSGVVTLTVTARDSCGSSTSSTKSIAVMTLPTIAVTGTEIVRGDPAQLRLDLTGTPPWTVKWRDLAQAVSVSATPAFRTITPGPNVTTTYWVDTVASSGCTATVNASAVVHVLPLPPGFVVATTRSNDSLVVDVAWSAVTGATGYQVERTTVLGGAATPITINGGATTAYVDFVSPSATPVTYIYYVRTKDGETSRRGPFDFATVATTYQQSPIVRHSTNIKASDIVELRRGIDAVRGAFGLGAAFGSASPPTGLIRLSDFTGLVNALNEARRAVGYPDFGYTVGAPALHGTVLMEHITELREALR